MRRILIASLVIVMAVAFGCGSKEEEQRPAEQPARGATMAALVDPVDGTPVDIAEAQHSWVYNDVEYFFNSEKNMKAFQGDPEKYLSQRKR